MSKHKIKKQSIEFSKKIFYVVITVYITIIAYSMALMWYASDTSPLAYIIPSCGGLSATCIGFYYWKARKENEYKLRNIYGNKVDNSTDDDINEFDESDGDNL